MRKLVSLALLLSGCVTMDQTVTRQVAFDTKCPEKDVKVLAWGPNQNSVKVDACGTERQYSNVAGYTESGPNAPNWVEKK